LTAWILGVRPARAGLLARRNRAAFGKLRHLEGRVPHRTGFIEVKLDRETGGEVAIPDGVTALVRFDDASLVGGEFGPGRHRHFPLTPARPTMVRIGRR